MMGYAIRNISALPFGVIIGAPMKAAIEAQSMAAKQTVDFINAVGFKPDDPDTDPMFDEVNGAPENADIGEVRNITFSYKTKDPENNESTASLTVPILTIVPIPYLRIDEMTIDFMAKISETQSYTRKSDSTTSYRRNVNVRAGCGWFWGSASVGINASYSSRHSSSTEANSRYQTEMTMNVHVRAVQDELPAGLSKVLNILEGIIKEERAQVEETTPT